MSPQPAAPSAATMFTDARRGMDGSAYDATIDASLSIDLDEWTRRILRRHFDPIGGSPYWLSRAGDLGFDPLAVTRYDELVQFPPFPLAVLRDHDPADMVPRFRTRPLTGRIWDSGGTTGPPCRVYYTDTMLDHRARWRRWSWVAEGFEPGRTWLHAAPSGPHLIGNGAHELSTYFEAQVFAIDMDPRWVKRMIRDGRLAEVNGYTDHLVEQISDVLTHQRVQYLNTTPALFLQLARRRPELVARLDGARMSGTQISPAMQREIREKLCGGICGISYGNTFGISAHLPGPDDATIVYVPNYPEVTTTVVGREAWTTPVPYGSTGQVRMTVLHEDLFLPNVLERDQAVRYDTGGRWPTEGVANVRPLEIVSSSPEGLY